MFDVLYISSFGFSPEFNQSRDGEFAMRFVVFMVWRGARSLL